MRTDFAAQIGTVEFLIRAARPDHFPAETAKAKRKGRVFIEWLRNKRGTIAIAPFSVRDHPRAPMACPVSWDELPRIRKPGALSTAQALDRAGADTVRTGLRRRSEQWRMQR